MGGQSNQRVEFWEAGETGRWVSTWHASLGCDFESPDLYKPGQAIQVCNPRVPMAKWETETRKYLEAHGQLTWFTEPQRTKERPFLEPDRKRRTDTQACLPMSTWAVWRAHSTYTHAHEYDCTERGGNEFGGLLCWLNAGCAFTSLG